MYSDGTEFQLRVDNVVVDFLPHLDSLLFSCFDYKVSCLNCKKRSCSVECFFFIIYFLCFLIFHQSSIRLQLHTETKRSILNHSF